MRPRAGYRSRYSVQSTEFTVELVTQFALEDFANGAAGQLVGENQTVQTLGLAHLLVEPLQDVLGRSVEPRPEHGITNRGFAPAGRGDADNSDLQQIRMLAQHSLQIAGIDVETTADDHVPASIHEREEAIFIEPADITGTDETLAGVVIPFGFSGFFRLVQITTHHGHGMAHHLAYLAGWQFVTFLIDDPYVMAFQWRAHGIQFVGKLMSQQHA